MVIQCTNCKIPLENPKHALIAGGVIHYTIFCIDLIYAAGVIYYLSKVQEELSGHGEP
jgi:hypothetical protein